MEIRKIKKGNNTYYALYQNNRFIRHIGKGRIWQMQRKANQPKKHDGYGDTYAVCSVCGNDLLKAPAKFDDEPTFCGYLPCPKHPKAPAKYQPKKQVPIPYPCKGCTTHLEQAIYDGKVTCYRTCQKFKEWARQPETVPQIECLVCGVMMGECYALFLDEGYVQKKQGLCRTCWEKLYPNWDYPGPNNSVLWAEKAEYKNQCGKEGTQ